MLFVVKKKRLNDFKEVRTARPRDLYKRYGRREPNTDFESSDEPIKMNMNTLDSLEYIHKYDTMMAQQELNRGSGGTDAESHGNDSEQSVFEKSDDE